MTVNRMKSLEIGEMKAAGPLTEGLSMAARVYVCATQKPFKITRFYCVVFGHK